jgi:hypothetical protein
VPKPIARVAVVREGVRRAVTPADRPGDRGRGPILLRPEPAGMSSSTLRRRPGTLSRIAHPCRYVSGWRERRIAGASPAHARSAAPRPGRATDGHSGARIGARASAGSATPSPAGCLLRQPEEGPASGEGRSHRVPASRADQVSGACIANDFRGDESRTFALATMWRSCSNRESGACGDADTLAIADGAAASGPRPGAAAGRPLRPSGAPRRRRPQPGLLV